jgi:hypothetical protein
MDAYLDHCLRRAESGTSTYIEALDLRRYIEELEAKLKPFIGPGRVKTIVFVPEGTCSKNGGCDCEPLTD